MSTALILEDDVDWDPRLKSQLTTFGTASQQLPSLLQHQLPLSKSDRNKKAEAESVRFLQHHTLLLGTSANLERPAPYGLEWDVLWLGHCGTSLPPPLKTNSTFHAPDRVMVMKDPTVSDSTITESKAVLQPEDTDANFPSQARIYHRSHRTLCTLAYAVTQAGAQKILYEHGIRNLDKGYDFALSEWCDGRTPNMGARPMCLTSSPSVFGHFWPTNGDAGGGKSDIMGVGVNGPPSSILVESFRGGLEVILERDK